MCTEGGVGGGRLLTVITEDGGVALGSKAAVGSRRARPTDTGAHLEVGHRGHMAGQGQVGTAGAGMGGDTTTSSAKEQAATMKGTRNGLGDFEVLYITVSRAHA